MDRGAWWAAVHGVARSQTRLSTFTFTFHFHALEKEMATHSSVLAWALGLSYLGLMLWISARAHPLYTWPDAAAAILSGGIVSLFLFPAAGLKQSQFSPETLI